MQGRFRPALRRQLLAELEALLADHGGLCRGPGADTTAVLTALAEGEVRIRVVDVGAERERPAVTFAAAGLPIDTVGFALARAVLEQLGLDPARGPVLGPGGVAPGTGEEARPAETDTAGLSDEDTQPVAPAPPAQPVDAAAAAAEAAPSEPGSSALPEPEPERDAAAVVPSPEMPSPVSGVSGRESVGRSGRFRLTLAGEGSAYPGSGEYQLGAAFGVRSRLLSRLRLSVELSASQGPAVDSTHGRVVSRLLGGVVGLGVVWDRASVSLGVGPVFRLQAARFEGRARAAAQGRSGWAPIVAGGLRAGIAWPRDGTWFALASADAGVVLLGAQGEDEGVAVGGVRGFFAAIRVGLGVALP